MTKQDKREVSIACSVIMIVLAVLAGISGGAEPTTAEGYLERIAADAAAAKALLAKPEPQPQPQPDPQPTPQPTPQPQPGGNVATPFGYYGLQTGNPSVLNSPGMEISESELRRPLVVGLTIRIRPNFVIDGGQWRPAFIDRNVAKCERTGDGFTLLMMSGGTRDPWIESNVSAYERIAAWMGQRYSGHPLCKAVHATGCTPYETSEELHWKPQGEDKYTPAIEAANKRLITAYARAFPRQTIILAIGGGYSEGMRRLIDHGLQVAPARLLVKHNSLKQSTVLSASHWQLLKYAASKGAMIGWEMVDVSSKVERFGPGGVMAGIEQARTFCRQIGYPFERTYRAIYPSDLAGLR